MNDAHSQERVIKADKKARTLVIVAYIVAVVLLMVLVKCMLTWSEGQLEDVEPTVVLRIIQAVIGFIFLCIVPFGVYLCRFGRRAIMHRQMPPGTTVIMDTELIEGDKP